MEVDVISLFEPECGAREMQLVSAVLKSARWGDGPMVESFERAFAGWAGRKHAVAVGSGTLGTWIALRALGIGPGDEVICTAHTWHQVAQAITLAGATPVFSDINYWTGSLSPEKAALKITPKTRAMLAGNTNGHPAAWEPLRALAQAHGLVLIEDSTESFGSRYKGQAVGTFGDVSVFDFSAPSALCTGEGIAQFDDIQKSVVQHPVLQRQHGVGRAFACCLAGVGGGVGGHAAQRGVFQLPGFVDVLQNQVTPFDEQIGFQLNQFRHHLPRGIAVDDVALKQGKPAGQTTSQRG